jgi:hypothetical protein
MCPCQHSQYGRHIEVPGQQCTHRTAHSNLTADSADNVLVTIQLQTQFWHGKAVQPTREPEAHRVQLTYGADCQPQSLSVIQSELVSDNTCSTYTFSRQA